MNSKDLVGYTLNGRYEVIENIGTGGMAAVFKAKDTLLNRFVAIKVLKDSLEDEQQVVTNFIKEAQSSASLVHNNIVSVYDVGEDNGINYMVMELVDGITLKEYIKEKGPLPWQEACDYAIQIGQGINEAHSKNIIHRDIKPQNIIMTKDKTLKVTDFGIARAMASDTTVVGGTALGSVHYISPEQARGGYTDARSDIYSLGVVLYEMISGKVPFDGDTPVSVALMHLEKEPVNVKCVNMDIPSDLAYVTMKAISKEQKNRYQNVQEMLNDLHAVLADELLPSKEEDEIIRDKEEKARKKITEEALSNANDTETLIEEDELNEGRRGRKTRKKAIKKKTELQKKEDRIATVLAISTVLVILLISIGAIFIINARKEASVPNLVNMTLDEATKAAEEAGFVIADEIEYSLSDDVAEGSVISQDPTANRMIAKNSEINLVVSIGSSGGDIAVPDVRNKTFDEAISDIMNTGLTYAVVEEFSSEIEAGRVIRQSPIAGTKLNADDIVTVHISKGAQSEEEANAAVEKVSVPNVVDMGREQAENVLTQNGLYASVTKKASPTAEGTVISQSPAGGREVSKGSFVSIVISSGNAGSTQSSSSQTPSEENGEAENTPAEENTGTSTGNNQTNTGTSSESESSGNSSSETSNGGSSGQTSEGNSSGTSSQGGSSSSNETGGESESSQQESGVSTRTFTVKIPEAANDMVDVEIVANGRTVHNAMHSKDEGSVSVEISGSGTATVQAYIDGAKVSDKTIEF